MYIFFKSNIAALSATGIDYLVTFLLVHFGVLSIVESTTTGTLCGGAVNFLIGRSWVFHSRERPMDAQAIKFILVWTGNLVLNTLGVYALTSGLGINYMLAKVSTSILVGVLYNYLMQKRYVFAHD